MVSQAQLEAPLDHADTWALLPVRKPLLTKRSRRCRLLARSTARDTDPNNPAPSRICKGIVVKPQINPCSNPPFQKNNAAVHFVPRCVPWAWESGWLLFSLVNPLDADMKVKLDPTAFNTIEGVGSS